MTPAECAVAILASGTSARFEHGDKLLAMLQGVPVAEHVIKALGSVPFRERLAVVPDGNAERRNVFDDAGYSLILNNRPQEGMGRSLSLAAKTALELNVRGLLIVLADMPFVTDEFLLRLIAQIHDADAAIAFCNDVRSPPVLFNCHILGELSNCTGDHGGRNILNKSPNVIDVPASEDMMTDIDTVEQLARQNRS